MLKLKLSTLFLGLIFPYFLIGQYSDFDLSKYRLPDIKTDRLDLNFNLYKTGNKSISRISDLDTIETKQNNFRSSLDLNYYHFRNSEKYQGDLMVDANFNPQINSSSYNELITKGNSIHTNFLIQSKNIFFNQNMNFIEVNPHMSFYSINNRSHQDLSSSSFRDDKAAQFTTNISIPVSIGHGRIEPVEDVRLAIYILEELNKVGRISALPSDNVILEMAKEISKIKRSRFFDSRIRKIKELQVVDSFLVANNIISSNDINYFSVLNDQWDFAYGPPRESGFAISSGFDNNIAFNKSYLEAVQNNNVISKDSSNEYIYELGGFLKARYAKPINLYWQTSASILTSYNLQFTRNPEDKDNQTENFRTNIFRAYLNYSIQFLPNSRSSIKLKIDGSFLNSHGERTLIQINPIDYQIKNNQLTLSPGLDLYYYISPQLRIQLNSSIYLYNAKDLKTYEMTYSDNEQIWNRNQHNISLQLIYSFF